MMMLLKLLFDRRWKSPKEDDLILQRPGIAPDDSRDLFTADGVCTIQQHFQPAMWDWHLFRLPNDAEGTHL